MRFFGREKVSVDSKGRTSLPARFRDVLKRLPDDQSSTLILVPWFSVCLRAYPLPEFERMLDAFETRVAEAEALGQGDDESDLRRLLYGGAMDVQLDAHGRLVLPHTIRKEVGISTEVYWTTGGNYLELWNPERLHAHESVARQETLRTQFAALSRTTVRPDAGPIVRTAAANPDGGEA
jgi:MraZ protein